MAESEDEALNLIQSNPEGVLQSELWKELGVDSRKCSRIVKKLEENGLIERIEYRKDDYKLRSQTFLRKKDFTEIKKQTEVMESKITKK